MSVLSWTKSGGVFDGRYFCEMDKNAASYAIKVTYKFISSWTVLTPVATNNQFTVTLQPG